VTEIVAELDAGDFGAERADAICRRHLVASGTRPELAGRIGGFLVFRPLSARARAEIATAAIAKVAAEYGLTIVHIDPAVVSMIASQPYDQLGARPDEYRVDDLLGMAFAQYAEDGQGHLVSVAADPGLICRPP
jgi:ATP-dependent Clp protease ATP-binding subunit ClpA